MSISRSRPPAFAVISSHCLCVRWSFQSSAGRSALSPLPRNTLPCICPDRPTPETSAGLTPAFFSTARVALTVACHQSSGCCSLHPGLGEKIGCSAIAVASTRPSSSQIRVLVPLVPMSIPSRWGMRRNVKCQRSNVKWSDQRRRRQELAILLRQRPPRYLPIPRPKVPRRPRPGEPRDVGPPALGEHGAQVRVRPQPQHLLRDVVRPPRV